MAKIIVILEDKDGNPDTLTFDNVTDETVLVNFIDGTVKMESHDKPTLINSATGEPYPDQG